MKTCDIQINLPYISQGAPRRWRREAAAAAAVRHDLPCILITSHASLCVRDSVAA